MTTLEKKSASMKKKKSTIIDVPVSDPLIKEYVDKTYAENKQVFEKLAKL